MRPERHRTATESWLRRFGVKSERLYLAPDGLEQRLGLEEAVNGHNGARFRESDARQTAWIREVAGKWVVYPNTKWAKLPDAGEVSSESQNAVGGTKGRGRLTMGDGLIYA